MGLKTRVVDSAVIKSLELALFGNSNLVKLRLASQSIYYDALQPTPSRPLAAGLLAADFPNSDFDGCWMMLSGGGLHTPVQPSSMRHTVPDSPNPLSS